MLNAWHSANIHKTAPLPADDVPEEVLPAHRSTVVNVGTIPVVLPPLAPPSPGQQQH